MRHLRSILAFAWLALFLGPAAAQDSDRGEREALRRRILERVERILNREVERIRTEIQTLLDRELGLGKEEGGPAEREGLPPHHPKVEPAHPEHPEHPGKKPPAHPDEDDIDLSPEGMSQEYQALSRKFESAMNAHVAGKYDESIAGFREVAERIDDPDMKASATYNVACGYALKGDKGRGMRWLRRAVELGFDDVGHIQADTDLTALHGMDEFEKLLAELRAHGDEGEEDGEEEDEANFR